LRTRAGIVVAVGGPPHSGKSVFVSALYKEILSSHPTDFVFLERAAPDGEGMWAAEADPELVAQIRRKSAFADEFVQRTAQGVARACECFPLLLVDLGGKRAPDNAALLKLADGLIVLSSDNGELQAWCAFAETNGCEVFATLRSRLGATDAVSSVDVTCEPVVGTLRNLLRDGPSTPYAGAIQDLARWLVARTHTKCAAFPPDHRIDHKPSGD